MLSANPPHRSNWSLQICCITISLLMITVTSLYPKTPSFPSRLPKEIELPNNFSSHNVTPTLSGRAPKFGIFSGERSQKGEVLFDQWSTSWSSCMALLSLIYSCKIFTDYSRQKKSASLYYSPGRGTQHCSIGSSSYAEYSQDTKSLM